MTPLKQDSRRRVRGNAWLCAALIMVAAGCGEERLETRFGSLRGRSVNGTGVLAEMFKARGHRVTTARYLSPKLWERGDVIIWAPDDFEPPSREVRLWLEEWLQVAPGRAIVFIGRDYDAAPEYWRRAAIGAPSNLAAEYQRRQGEAQTRYDAERAFPIPGLPQAGDDADWFTYENMPLGRRAQELQSDNDGLTDIDPAKVEITLHGRMTPATEMREVVGSDLGTIVAADDIAGSTLYLVVNGSFLLNLPLVNHEHRKLAGWLIDEIEANALDEEPRHVVFLESGYSGPLIFEDEPSGEEGGLLQMLNRHPLNWIGVHLAALGAIFCLARWPIFGPVRKPETPSSGDFGQHVIALGEMLKRTGDRSFAAQRLQAYQQAAERDIHFGTARGRRKRSR